MALLNTRPFQNVNVCSFNKTYMVPLRVHFLPLQKKGLSWRPLVVEAKMRKRANTRTDNAKILNRRFRKKEVAKEVGEELVKAAVKLDINEISSYDRNGFAVGERISAFEIAISEHGFLLR